MLAHLGIIAHQSGLSTIEIKLINTGRNQPALDFLMRVGEDYQEEIDNGYIFIFPSDYASAIQFLPASGDKNKSQRSTGQKVESKQISSEQPNTSYTKSVLINHISSNLYSADLIMEIIDSQKLKKRPDIREIYEVPTNELERSIANIWQRVLGIENAGINDNFFDIGGTSLKAVRMISIIGKELNLDVSLMDIFECPSISSLSKKLSGDQKRNEMVSEGRSRGEIRRSRNKLRLRKRR